MFSFLTRAGVLVAAMEVLGLLLYWFGRDYKAPTAQSLSNSSTIQQDNIRRIATAVSVAPTPLTSESPTTTFIPNAGETLICGIGPVKLNKNGRDEWNRFSASMTDAASERWRTSLLSSKDVRAQSAGYVFQAAAAEAKALHFALQQFGPCDEHDESCSRRLQSAKWAIRENGDADSNDALVQLAIASPDPAVYAMALHVCGIGSNSPLPGSCRLLSAKQWTLIDADNAASWLMLATSAYEMRDYVGQAAALARAAQANKFEWYGDSLLAYSQSTLGNVSPLERAILTLNTANFQSQWSEPKTYVSIYCMPPASAAGGKRHDVCSSLAELFLSNGRTFVDMEIGMQLSKYVGWPKEKLDALAIERDALLQARVEMVGHWPPLVRVEFFSCDGLKRYNDFLAQVTLVGELGAARDAIRRSGLSLQELADRYHEMQTAAKRTAQSEQSEESAEATQ